ATPPSKGRDGRATPCAPPVTLACPFWHADDAADEVLTLTSEVVRSSFNLWTSPVWPAHGGHSMMTVVSVLVAVLVFASVPPLGAEEVTIEGRDFTLDAPAALPAGSTAFVSAHPRQVPHPT